MNGNLPLNDCIFSTIAQNHLLSAEKEITQCFSDSKILHSLLNFYPIEVYLSQRPDWNDFADWDEYIQERAKFRLQFMKEYYPKGEFINSSPLSICKKCLRKLKVDSILRDFEKLKNMFSKLNWQLERPLKENRNELWIQEQQEILDYSHIYKYRTSLNRLCAAIIGELFIPVRVTHNAQWQEGQDYNIKVQYKWFEPDAVHLYYWVPFLCHKDYLQIYDDEEDKIFSEIRHPGQSYVTLAYLLENTLHPLCKFQPTARFQVMFEFTKHKLPHLVGYEMPVHLGELNGFPNPMYEVNKDLKLVTKKAREEKSVLYLGNSFLYRSDLDCFYSKIPCAHEENFENGWKVKYFIYYYKNNYDALGGSKIFRDLHYLSMISGKKEKFFDFFIKSLKRGNLKKIRETLIEPYYQLALS